MHTPLGWSYMGHCQHFFFGHRQYIMTKGAGEEESCPFHSDAREWYHMIIINLPTSSLTLPFRGPISSNFNTMLTRTFQKIISIKNVDLISLCEHDWIFKVRRLHNNFLTQFGGCGNKQTSYIMSHRVHHIYRSLSRRDYSEPTNTTYKLRSCIWLLLLHP